MRYLERKYYKKSEERLDAILEIIEEYKQYLPLTVRQIYYQFITKYPHLLGKMKAPYGAIEDLVKNARYTGHIRMDFIADSMRTVDNLPMSREHLMKYYYPDAWIDQPNYIEVFIEKHALKTLYNSFLRPFFVPLNASRGFPSVSQTRRIAERLHQHEDKNRYVFVFTDFDPAGNVMTPALITQISKHLYMMGELDYELEYPSEMQFVVRTDEEYFDIGLDNLQIEKIALNDEQVDAWNLPENVIDKKGYSASKRFIDEYGDRFTELDAISPELTGAIIAENIYPLIDMDIVEKKNEERRLY